MKLLIVCSGNSKAGISPIVRSQGESLKKNGIDLDYFTIVGKGTKGREKIKHLDEKLIAQKIIGVYNKALDNITV